MNKKVIVSLAFFCLLTLSYTIFLHIKTSALPKVGIVQMEKYVYEFEGMKDASMDYLAKVNKWNAQADSMKTELKEVYREIQMDSLGKDKEKLRSDVQKFDLMMKFYNEHQQKMENKAKVDDEQMTRGIFNQLQGYMKEYAQKEGFDLIISNTEVNNVGFVTEAMDITNEMVDFANSRYNNEK